VLEHILNILQALDSILSTEKRKGIIIHKRQLIPHRQEFSEYISVQNTPEREKYLPLGR
jgi:hypothetical protein